MILRIFTGSIWFGLQLYWGGQAVRVAIGAVVPRTARLPVPPIFPSPPAAII